MIGDSPVSRAGWCQLSNLQLTELAGDSAERFVQIAVSLATDLPRLAALRATLRRRMELSPLMDAAGFARGIESVYRQVWRRWCDAPTA
jgi:predicted O-linked N-acetylglucosamine transferase (SPINDLY family)